MRVSTVTTLACLVAFAGVVSASRNAADIRPIWVRQVAAATPSMTTSTSTTTSSASAPTGTAANGAACKMSTQCASGNCYHSKCADPLTLGQTGCYKDVGCTTGNCNKGRCVPQDGSGLDGDRCNASTQCASGNCSRSQCAEQTEVGSACYKNVNCQTGNCVNETCIANASVAIGDKCNRSQQCKAGDYCRHGACSPMRPNGSRCYKDQGCISNACYGGHCITASI
jgi:hypothetical protein